MSKTPANGLLVALFVGIIIVVSGTDRTTAVSEQIQPDLPPGTFVARVSYNDISDIDQLSEYDVWEYNNLEERYVLVALTGLDYVQLDALGWQIEVDKTATNKINNPSVRPFADGYRTVDEIFAELENINNQNPALTELVTYGFGICYQQDGCLTPGEDFLAGYPLQALRISNETVPGTSTVDENGIKQGSKPVFFLVANVHARELTTVEISMRLIDWLLSDYGLDADVTWLVDWHEIWVIPTANPEGHWLVELGSLAEYGGTPFFQRKNANLDADGDSSPDCTMWPPSVGWQYGVDLNRNHSFGWGPPGASPTPCSQIFHGPGPASEAETAALQDLIAYLIPDQRGPEIDDPAPVDTKGLLLTLHSYSELILRPWGFTDQTAPNEAGLKAIGDKMASYNGYLSCQPGSCLYAASGTTDDWTYGELGIPAFTFEIGDEFMPPYKVIDEEQWPENKPAFLYAAKIARTPYATVLGPDATQVEAEMLPGNSQLRITAVLDESDHGGQIIKGAAFTIDDPFWSAAALPYPMDAVDGAFDSVRESVAGLFDLTSLSPGQHIVFVHGQDIDDNWGVTSAIFILVPNNQPFFSFVPFAAAEQGAELTPREREGASLIAKERSNGRTK
jgi:carboxypeptidase T